MSDQVHTTSMPFGILPATPRNSVAEAQGAGLGISVSPSDRVLPHIARGRDGYNSRRSASVSTGARIETSHAPASTRAGDATFSASQSWQQVFLTLQSALHTARQTEQAARESMSNQIYVAEKRVEELEIENRRLREQGSRYYRCRVMTHTDCLQRQRSLNNQINHLRRVIILLQALCRRHVPRMSQVLPCSRSLTARVR